MPGLCIFYKHSSIYKIAITIVFIIFSTCITIANDTTNYRIKQFHEKLERLNHISRYDQIALYKEIEQQINDALVNTKSIDFYLLKKIKKAQARNFCFKGEYRLAIPVLNQYLTSFSPTHSDSIEVLSMILNGYPH